QHPALHSFPYTTLFRSNDRADKSFPSHQGFGDRCLMEFSGEEKNQAVQAATARCAGRHMAHAAEGHRSRAGIPEMYRMFSLPGRSEEHTSELQSPYDLV